MDHSGTDGYDAFLSYSRKDARIARALRRGIEWCGVPWRWRRKRRLHLYLDTVAQGGTSALWTDIESALARSAWLILLASPASASSPSVGRELRWWLEHRSPDRILIGVVAGATPHWRDGGLRGAGADNPIHPELSVGLTTEPGFTDLRDVSRLWPRPGKLAADFAAPLLGVADKDQIVGEYRRVQRRTRSLTAAALAVIVVLAGLSVSYATAASERARIAAARGFMSAAEASLAASPETALRMGLAAYALTPTAEARAALVTSLARTPFAGTVAGHATRVTAAAFHPDGRFVVTGDDDGVLGLSDTADPGAPTRPFPPRPEAAAAVSTLAFSPDGGTLFAAYQDGVGDWWDTSDLDAVHLLTTQLAHEAEVTAAAFDGDVTLATAAGDGMALWDVADPTRPRKLMHEGAETLDDVSAVAFDDRDPLLLAAGPGPYVLAVDVTDPAQAHDVDLLVPDIGSWGQVVALSPDGRYLFAGMADTTAVLVWRVTVFGRLQPSVQLSVGGEATALSFSPDGRRLVVGTATGTVTAWDVTLSNDPLRTAEFATGAEAVRVVAAGAGSVLVTAGNPDTRLWDTSRVHPAPRTAIPGPYEDPDAPAGQVEGLAGLTGVSVALDHGGTRLAGLFGNGIGQVWDLTGSPAGDPRSGPPGPFGDPGSGTFDPFGDAGSGMFDPFGDAGQLNGPAQPMSALAMDASGRLLVTGTPTGELSVIEIGVDGDRAEVGHATVRSSGIADLGVSADGRTLLVAGVAGDVSAWSLADRTAPHRLADLVPAGSGGPTIGPGSRVSVPGSGGPAAVSTPETGVTLWDLTDPAGPRRWATVTDSVASGLALDPAGRSLVTVDGKGARVWDIERPQQPTLAATLTRDAATAAAVSPDGRLLVLSLDSREFAVWDLTELRQPRQLLRIANHAAPVYAAAFSGDGKSLVTTDTAGRFVVSDLGSVAEVVADPVATACRVTGRGLTRAEWADLAAPPVSYLPTCG